MTDQSPPRSMDVVASLKKIARELREGADPEAAAYLINWIADALDYELQLAAERGRQIEATWKDERYRNG